MINSARAALLVAAITLAESASAQNSVDGVTGAVKSALSSAAVNLIQPKIMGWLAAFLTLQFVLTNIRKLVNGADLQEVLAKGFGMFVSAGMCLLAVTEGPAFIDKVGNSLLKHFLSSIPTAGDVIALTLATTTTLIAAAFAASAINDAMANILVGMFWMVAGGGVYLACKVFMFYLELGMVVILAPLSFTFLGLDSLKDQGLAPLRSLISLVYRAVLFGVIFAAYAYVTDNAADAFKAISWKNPLAIIDNLGKVVDALLAYPVLLFLAFKSDSIAAGLASGSTSLGTGDVAQAAAIGAAAGATAASAGAATNSAAVKVPQSMSNFFGKMAGGSGSISNASPMGSGGGDAPKFTPPAPSMSAGGSPPAAAPAADNATPPARPQAAAAQGTPGTPTKPQGVASGRYGAPLPGEQGDAPKEAALAQNGPAPVENATQGAVPTPPQSASTPADAAPGSALPAAISGQNQPQPSDTPQHQGPRKPTIWEHLGKTNSHMSQERAETRISMSPHHHD